MRHCSLEYSLEYDVKFGFYFRNKAAGKTERSSGDSFRSALFPRGTKM